MPESITRDWLLANGFVGDPILGLVRELSRGPGDTILFVSVGRTTFNAPGVMVWVGGFGVVANAVTCEDVLALIRLLEGARIDHPYEAESVEYQDDA